MDPKALHREARPSMSSSGSVGSDISKPKGRSCAECRRLKIKCDRKVPCAGCTKRGYPELCPDRCHIGSKRMAEERDILADRVRSLEQIIEKNAYTSYLGDSGGGSEGASGQHFDPSLITGPPSNPIHSSDSAPTISPHHTHAASQSYQPVLADYPSELDIAAFTSGSAHPTAKQDDENGQSEVVTRNPGTLVAIYDRRYTFVGPSAGMQWLREDQHRKSSPAPIELGDPASPSHTTPARIDRVHVLPTPAEWNYPALHSQLPEYPVAQALADSFFDRAAWLGSTITAPDFALVLQRVYIERHPSNIKDDNRNVAYLELALVAAVLALGTAVDMETPPLDPQAIRLITMAQQALVSGRYMAVPSLTCLEALCLISKALTYVDLYLRWDVAWQLLGVGQRLIQAMGLHRDGRRWDLDARVVDQRRRIFWEIYITDVFMTTNWDRLTGPARDEYDTLYPDSWTTPNRTFNACLADLARLAKDTLDVNHKIQPAKYSTVSEVWRKICDLETGLPFHLRCRASMKAMVSKYANSIEAENASPPATQSDRVLTLQQHYLAIQSCSTVCSLLRPYFVEAMKESPVDPTQSSHAGPFLAVIERSSMTLAAVRSLHALLPMTSFRHWFFWSHAFTAAMCLGITALVSPTCSLVPLAMRDFDGLIAMLPQLSSHLPRETFRKDIEWLQVLYQKARESTDQASAVYGAFAQQSALPSAFTNSGSIAMETEKQMQMIGWKSRLIKRARNDGPSASHISPESHVSTGPLLDLNLWPESLPSTTDWGTGMSCTIGPDSTDWLQQLLDTSKQQHAPVLGDSDFDLSELWQH